MTVSMATTTVGREGVTCGNHGERKCNLRCICTLTRASANPHISCARDAVVERGVTFDNKHTSTRITESESLAVRASPSERSQSANLTAGESRL